jgi:hypothetical protein
VQGAGRLGAAEHARPVRWSLFGVLRSGHAGGV